MATTTDYINSLKQDKTNLVNNLIEKGVEATEDETFTSLVPKVLDIQSGGGTTVEKGFVINAYDSDGYVTEASIVGMTAIPRSYVQCATNAYGFFIRLKTIHLSNDTTSIGYSAFYNCINLVLRELHSNIISIGGYAFRDCYSMDELTCYGDLSSIESGAFYNDKILNKFVLPNVTKVPTLGSNGFYGTPIASGTGYIYFPDTLVETAKNSTNWSQYADQIKGVSEL